MSSVSVPILKGAYLSHLKERIANSTGIVDYTDADFFDLEESGLFMRSAVMAQGEVPELTISSEASHDVENAVKLHEWLANLTPIQASDQRLWAYLTHGPFFSYTKARFPFGASDTAENIRSHWFVGKGLRRNAISRLWLAANLTHAPWKVDPGLECFQRADPYHYTRLLLGNQNVYQQLIEREFGSCVITLTVTLDVIHELRNEISNLTDFAAAIGKDLNLIASHTDIGAVEPGSLRADIKTVANRLIGN